jgi:glycosidase
MFKDSADEGTKALLKREYQKKSRDNARTPMQWDDSTNAGFTTGSAPWMRVNENYPRINAASQVKDADSVYHTYRVALEMRKLHKDIFVYGDFEPVDEDNDKVFAYRRVASNGDAALVVCNFSTEDVVWPSSVKARQVLLSPRGQKVQDVNGGEIRLAPCEAIALLL